ncbi:MAG: hypothetical protein FWD26_05330 [Treponema sp.]|nr:hypothetical protein [Treponema sp.]
MKNKKKMTPQQAIATGVLVLGGAGIALGLVACKEPECKCSNKDHTCTCNLKGCVCFQRTFVIPIGEHNITVKDTRTGSNDKQLDYNGTIDADVIHRLTAGLTTASASPKFATVANRGLTIEVKDNPGYDYFKIYTWNKIGFNLDYILSDDGLFAVFLQSAIDQAEGKDENFTAKANSQSNIRMAKTVPPVPVTTI